MVVLRWSHSILVLMCLAHRDHTSSFIHSFCNIALRRTSTKDQFPRNLKTSSPSSRRGRGRSRNVIIVCLPAGALQQYCSLLRSLVFRLFLGTSIRDGQRGAWYSTVNPIAPPSQSSPRHRLAASEGCVFVWKAREGVWLYCSKTFPSLVLFPQYMHEVINLSSQLI